MAKLPSKSPKLSLNSCPGMRVSMRPHRGHIGVKILLKKSELGQPESHAGAVQGMEAAWLQE